MEIFHITFFIKFPFGKNVLDFMNNFLFLFISIEKILITIALLTHRSVAG